MDMFAKQGPGSQKVILGQLMAHAIEGVEAKAAKASIKYLLKRLQSKEELCSLMTAVTTKGGQPTSCVMMNRIVDGRIHINGGAGGGVFPHLIYSQLWCWPQVTIMNSISSQCRYAYCTMESLVCVNLYHYELQAGKGLLNSVSKLG